MVNAFVQLVTSADWKSISEVAIAVGTLVLAIATIRLAGATSKSASQTKKAVDLERDQLALFKEQLSLQATELEVVKGQTTTQADQLSVFKEQLALGREQWVQSEAASRPMLRALLGQAFDEYTTVSLHWVHGLVPVQDAEVWIKSQRGLRVARHDYMVPGDGNVHLYAFPATKEDEQRLPFDDLRQPVSKLGEAWIAADWRGADGKLSGWSMWTYNPTVKQDAYGQPLDEAGNPIKDAHLKFQRRPGAGPVERHTPAEP